MAISQLEAGISYIIYSGDGAATTYPIPFERILDAHVIVSVDDARQTLTTDYTIVGSSVEFVTPPTSSNQIKIWRETPLNVRLVDFEPGTTLTASLLDKDSLQAFYGLQEFYDRFLTGVIDLENQGPGTSTPGTETSGGSSTGGDEVTLDGSGFDAGNLIVFHNGILVAPADWTLNSAGDTLTFTYVLTAGDQITVYDLSGKTTVSTVGTDAVGTAGIQDGAVTTAKIADNAVTNAKLSVGLQNRLTTAESDIDTLEGLVGAAVADISIKVKDVPSSVGPLSVTFDFIPEYVEVIHASPKGGSGNELDCGFSHGFSTSSIPGGTINWGYGDSNNIQFSSSMATDTYTMTFTEISTPLQGGKLLFKGYKNA